MLSTSTNPETNSCKCELINPKTFRTENHFYPKAVNTHLSDVVKQFMTLDTPQLVTRFCKLHPDVKEAELIKLISCKPMFLNWSGSDLFHVSDHSGSKSMILVETNSCPSGQKSMPKMSFEENQNNLHRGYRTLIENTFKPMLEEHERLLGSNKVTEGKLAVVYDKNKMENWGYAATIADVFGESVYLVEYKQDDENPSVQFVENQQVMQIRDSNNYWINVRACFRYVTQKPWNRLPISKIRTLVINPVICCLAGGRNKQLASIAFSKMNKELRSGLQISTPFTVYNVEKKMVPNWITYFGGVGVVKNPYSNAGQGVWCIINQKELKEFMNSDCKYEKLIVQSMIGCKAWENTHYYHIGTVPDEDSSVFVADLRMMVHFDFNKSEFRPLALFARKARKPLHPSMDSDGISSWDMLGTNLTVVGEKGKSWDTDQSRLITCDETDFPKLGLSLDNLIEAFVQSVLANIAIDKLAISLCGSTGHKFDRRLFEELNQDRVLYEELFNEL